MQATNLTPTPQANQVTNYNATQPILAAIRAGIDQSAKTGLLTEYPGTFPENTRLILPQPTIYTEHGTVAKGPGSLIGRG